MRNPEIELARAIKGHQNILICIQGSPDPDALASAFALKLLSEKHGKRARVVATKKLSLSQNQQFVKLLSLPYEVADNFANLLSWADSYMVVDHPSPEIKGVSDSLPCLVHIDHHEPRNCALTVQMQWRSKNVGSTSTLVSLILEKSYVDLKFSEYEMERMTTALLFGIQTDTDKYALAAKLDYSAIHFLSRFCNGKILRKIAAVPLSKTTASHLRLAEKNKKIYKDWLITGIGYVQEKNRDDIAIIADFLLRREKVALVVVYALIYNERKKRLTLDASLRSSDAKFRLNSMIRRITRNGGARKFKGAFQVNLDYFSEHVNRGEILALAETVTVAKLKNAKDTTYKYIVQEAVDLAKDKASSLFSLLRSRLKEQLNF